MKRILHIIRNPQIGGAEMLVKNIINANNDSDFHHYLIHIKPGPIIDLIDISKKDHIIYRKCKTWLFTIMALRNVIIDYSIDIIHTHQPIDSYAAVIATIKLHSIIIRTFHGYTNKYKTNRLLAVQNKILNRIFSKFVHLNIFVSNDLQSHYHARFPWLHHNNQTILYNGIDHNYLEQQNKSPIRQELKIPANSKLLAMVGSFSTLGRDQLTIAKAIRLFVEENSLVHFIFIGNTGGKTTPNSFTDCYQYCQENNLLNNIHFLGTRTDVGGIMKDVDLYIHSSNYETFGLALVEAMTLRIPCIASDIPAFREISNNGIYVQLFKKGDYYELYKIVTNELKNLHSFETSERIHKAHDFVMKNFTMEQYLVNLHQRYLECLKSYY